MLCKNSANSIAIIHSAMNYCIQSIAIYYTFNKASNKWTTQDKCSKDKDRPITDLYVEFTLANLNTKVTQMCVTTKTHYKFMCFRIAMPIAITQSIIVLWLCLGPHTLHELLLFNHGQNNTIGSAFSIYHEITTQSIHYNQINFICKFLTPIAIIARYI